jgi:hypothetical protein
MGSYFANGDLGRAPGRDAGRVGYRSKHGGTISPSAWKAEDGLAQKPPQPGRNDRHERLKKRETGVSRAADRCDLHERLIAGCRTILTAASVEEYEK